MKKILLPIAAIGVLLAGCSADGEKEKDKDKTEQQEVKTENQEQVEKLAYEDTYKFLKSYNQDNLAIDSAYPIIGALLFEATPDYNVQLETIKTYEEFLNKVHENKELEEAEFTKLSQLVTDSVALAEFLDKNTDDEGYLIELEDAEKTDALYAEYEGLFEKVLTAYNEQSVDALTSLLKKHKTDLTEEEINNYVEFIQVIPNNEGLSNIGNYYTSAVTKDEALLEVYKTILKDYTVAIDNMESKNPLINGFNDIIKTYTTAEFDKKVDALIKADLSDPEAEGLEILSEFGSIYDEKYQKLFNKYSIELKEDKSNLFEYYEIDTVRKIINYQLEYLLDYDKYTELLPEQTTTETTDTETETEVKSEDKE